MEEKTCIDCGQEFMSNIQLTDMCDECLGYLNEAMENVYENRN